MTSISASRGVVTAGNLTLAFHLVPDEKGMVLQGEDDSVMGAGPAEGIDS